MTLAVGDTVRVTVERLPVYASSGAGRGRRSVKVLEVKALGYGGGWYVVADKTHCGTMGLSLSELKLGSYTSRRVARYEVVEIEKI